MLDNGVAKIKRNRPGLEGCDLSFCAAVEVDAELVAETVSAVAAGVATSAVGDGNLATSCFTGGLRGLTAGAGLPVDVTAGACSSAETTPSTYDTIQRLHSKTDRTCQFSLVHKN